MKTIENINQVKKEMAQIRPVVENLLKVWPSNKLTMLSVLLQNLCFLSSSDVYGYSLEKDYDHCQDILNTIRSLADYQKDDSAVCWIADEISMIWDSHWIWISQEEEIRLEQEMRQMESSLLD